MDKKEYYKRIEKINDKFRTDRVSADEEYQLVCQRNYLSKRYIETLQNALDEIEKYINEFPAIRYASSERIKNKYLSGKLIPVDDLLKIIKKAKGE